MSVSLPCVSSPVDGTRRPLPAFAVKGPQIEAPLRFAPHEGYFVVFDRRANRASRAWSGKSVTDEVIAVIDGPYEVAFDPVWGGPERPVSFEKLADWKDHPDAAIKYYSGEAVYRKTFNRPTILKDSDRVFLDLGVVHKLARVKLNGEDCGIVWTPPYRAAVTGKLKPGPNRLEVIVVNTWVNRLIGDQQPADKEVRTLKWDNGMLGGRPQSAGRYTFSTARDYSAQSPLQESGLLGPVTLGVQHAWQKQEQQRQHQHFAADHLHLQAPGPTA